MPTGQRLESLPQERGTDGISVSILLGVETIPSQTVIKTHGGGYFTLVLKTGIKYYRH